MRKASTRVSYLIAVLDLSNPVPIAGFNIFQGSKPLDPVTVGFTIRVQLQHTDGFGSLPQYAYIMPTIDPPNPPAPSLSPPPPPAPDREVIEPPAKKFRTSRTRRGRANFSALDTVDELVSGGSRSNSAIHPNFSYSLVVLGRDPLIK